MSLEKLGTPLKSENTETHQPSLTRLAKSEMCTVLQSNPYMSTKKQETFDYPDASSKSFFSQSVYQMFTCRDIDETTKSFWRTYAFCEKQLPKSSRRNLSRQIFATCKSLLVNCL